MEEYFINKYSVECLEILKTPPPFSTIRVNTMKINMHEALEHISKIYNALEVYIHPLIHDVICITSVGPFNRNILSKCVYVDFKCGEAVLRGANIYCPGILGCNENCNNYIVQEDELLSIFAVKNTFTRGSKILLSEVAEKSFLGNGVSKLSRKNIFKVNKGTAIEMIEGRYLMPAFESLSKELFYPQNLGSIVVGHILQV